jgi:hypothetical protein
MSKMNKIEKISRGITVIILTVGLLVFPSCKSSKHDVNAQSLSSQTSSAQTADTESSGAIDVSMSGSINHETFTQGEKATIQFSRFPATVAEFRQVREKIGGEPHGAVALQLMAYEMYRRNKSIGEECIRLNSATNNVKIQLRRLGELFGKDENYARPYQIAAYLSGANPKNGYNPTAPYTIEIATGISADSYQESSIYQATSITLRVMTEGRDGGYQPVSVIKTLKPSEPSEGKYFMVYACSGIYVQVKPISFAANFEGLE